MTRDSVALKVLLLISVVLGVVAQVTDPALYGLDPRTGGIVMSWIKLVSLIVAAVTGWLQTSPLKGEHDGDQVTRVKGGNMGAWLLPLLLVSAVSCAGVTPRAQLVQTHQAIQTLLASVDDAERTLCFGSTILPTVPTRCTTEAATQAGLTDQRHQAIQGAFNRAYDAQIRLAGVIATWEQGASIDLNLAIAAATEVDAQLDQMNVSFPQLAPLIRNVQRWMAELARLRQLIGGGL